MGTTLDSVVQPGHRKGRPNYSTEFKRQIVAAASEPGASVSKLAMEHRLNANMVFRWRRELNAGSTTQAEQFPKMLPVVLNRQAPAAQMPTDACRIEVVIGDALVRISGNPDPVMLKSVFQSLRP